MTLRTLIRRSLRFHWRSHLGVVLGAAIGSAALIGALVVGDSVKGSLRERAMFRLSGDHLAMSLQDRFFGASLFDRIFEAGTNNASQVNSKPPTTPTVIWGSYGQWNGSVGLALPASAIRQDGAARANAVSCYGMDERFFKLLAHTPDVAPGTVFLNEALARQLDVQVGDRLIFRVQKPSALSTEASISRRTESSVALPLTVAKILPAWPGEFSLAAKATPSLNAFLSLQELQHAVAREGRANLMLISWGIKVQRPSVRDHMRHFLREMRPGGAGLQRGSLISVGEMADDRETLLLVQTYLETNWRLNDAETQLYLAASPSVVEIKSERIFLDPPIARSTLAADTNAQPILTYLATLLRSGTNAAPYSMVTAAGAPWTPMDLRDDETVVSQWLAEDLRVKPGDEIALSYFQPESGAKLEEATNTFRVHSIVPMEMPWSDRTLMPDFPGIEKAESTSEWDAGFPLTYKVRPKDDDYWKQHRGTPKAFITLAAGQKMWGNRFGNLTAIRFQIPSGSSGRDSAPTETGEGQSRLTSAATVDEFRTGLEKKILSTLKPEELGLRFEPVREQALKAAEESQDFGGLFLGFSFFVIAAALLLMAMLFQFGLEQRASEIGTLLALGFTPKQVRKLFLHEGVALAFIGGVIGAVGGIYYAKAMIHGLSTIWRDAVGATALSFHVTGQTLLIGIFASVVVSSLTIWLALRKFVNRPAMQLLTGADLECGDKSPSSVEGRLSWWRRVLLVIRRAALRGTAWATSRPSGKSNDKSPHSIAWLALAGAVGLVGWTLAHGDMANAGAFFGAGALVLVSGLAFASAKLSQMSEHPLTPSHTPTDGERDGVRGNAITLTSLALRGCARRRKRSLATIAMLACGSFLIVSMGVFRLDANRDATQKTSGTGGFALIGETAMPVVHDLNSASGRDFFALDEKNLSGVNVVPFRVRAGDEASCLNLNAAQKPRLLGVKPEMLRGRFGFAKGEGWQVLQSAMSQRLLTSSPTNEISAIGDANSIQWAMHKKIGDTIDYMDERGQPFKVRIVGAVANSILQGQLIIDEAEFVKRFPGESGYRMFLMDAPSNAVSQVSAALSRAMQDVGLELTPTVTRLNQFNAVQNTYLGTFQILGGLGLLLGSVGLGIVVLRNVLERRGELAVMMAVGFRKATLQQLLLMENGALLLAGLALGIIAAAVAVLPALLSANGELPVLSLAITLGAVLVNGAAWTWAATRFAVRGDLLKALRNE